MTTSLSILDQILAYKQIEVDRQRAKVSQAQLAVRAAAAPPVRDFAAALRIPGRVALIAEVKKASPSRGVLLPNFDALALAESYAANGAAAISVLTDARFFQGSPKFLEGIRLAQRPGRPQPPLLRKDFIIDPYQVYEARAYGADALLLIVAALPDDALREFRLLAETFGMQALVEVHDATELARALASGATLIGVNNRNLHTFVTTLETTAQLAALLPQDGSVLLVSESGIFTPADIAQVQRSGAAAVLVGEAIVTAPDIAAKVRELAHGAG
jgi:indole-3-glycerol phosphate synthase